jgi:hypothetical protein
MSKRAKTFVSNKKKNKPEFKPLRSGLERDVRQQLEDAGIKFEYEPEKLEYRKQVIRGICKCGNERVYQRRWYIPDFVLENGIRLECKGRLTSQDRSKLVAVKQQHPEIDLRLLFGANNKINKNKQKRYMQWAAENGIKAAVKEVPESWLKPSKGKQ